MGWIAVVLNDASGSGDGAEADAIFRAAGREVRITLAKTGEELRAAAERAVAGGCETLVAGGGDGTINTGAAAVVGRDTPLGVLALGP